MYSEGRAGSNTSYNLCLYLQSLEVASASCFDCGIVIPRTALQHGLRNGCKYNMLHPHVGLAGVRIAAGGTTADRKQNS